MLAEVLDPAAFEADEFATLADEADLGPEAIAASAANSAGAPAPEDSADPDPNGPATPVLEDMTEAPADEHHAQGEAAADIGDGDPPARDEAREPAAAATTEPDPTDEETP